MKTLRVSRAVKDLLRNIKMLQNNIELKILIKNKPITEYTHRGLTYVEGREGSEYELLIKNYHPKRVEVIVSVDGLSIIDGKLAGPDSSGYLLNAYETVKIPGWMVDQATAAKFKFGAKEKSYATGQTGTSVNNGVIGIMVYSEKVKVNPVFRGIYGSGASGIGTHDYTSLMNGGLLWNSACATQQQQYSTIPFVGSVNADLSQTIAAQNLGTEFGKATDFNTTTVQFERDAMIGTFVLYYDNKRGLESKGVIIKTKKKTQQAPDAFPAARIGCAVPAGWTK